LLQITATVTNLLQKRMPLC